MKIQIDEAPPSVNSMYRHSKYGTYMTAKGRDFKEYVQSHLNNLLLQGTIKSFGDARLKVEYEFNFKGKRKRDTDNYIKSVQDCLEEILFDNDEQIDELIAKRSYHNSHDHIIISITKLA